MVKTVLYANNPDGPLNVEFDEKKHKYTVNGEVWPSVTQAEFAVDLGKAGSFTWWSANEYREFLYLNWPLDPGTGQPRYVGPTEIVGLIEDGRKQHAAEKEEAADLGTETHKWIQQHIKSKLEFRESPPLPQDERVKNAVLAHLSREETRRAHYVGVERIVASREHRYIGTIDQLCEVEGLLVLGDHKTANDIRVVNRLQLAAYAAAWNEEHPNETIDKREVILLGKDSPTYEVHDLCYPGMTDAESMAVDFEAYLWAMQMCEWGKRAIKMLPKREKVKYEPPVAWAKAVMGA